jgi:plasmid stabilization system protein ParE
MTIQFAPEAEPDFVVEFLLDRNPSAAAEIGQRIFEVLDRLAANELEGAAYSSPVPPFRIHGSALSMIGIHHQARTPLAK